MISTIAARGIFKKILKLVFLWSPITYSSEKKKSAGHSLVGTAWNASYIVDGTNFIIKII